MCTNVVLRAAVEVCMIPCGRYWNEKRVNLYLGLGHKKQRGKADPMKESKEQLNGEEGEAAETHCQERDISRGREWAVVSVSRVQLSEG